VLARRWSAFTCRARLGRLTAVWTLSPKSRRRIVAPCRRALSSASHLTKSRARSLLSSVRESRGMRDASPATKLIYARLIHKPSGSHLPLWLARSPLDELVRDRYDDRASRDKTTIPLVIIVTSAILFYRRASLSPRVLAPDEAESREIDICADESDALVASCFSLEQPASPRAPHRRREG